MSQSVGVHVHSYSSALYIVQCGYGPGYRDHWLSLLTVKCLPQVEDLKWEVEQKQREIEAQKQQLEMMEQCSNRELDTLQTALQVRIHSW